MNISRVFLEGPARPRHPARVNAFCNHSVAPQGGTRMLDFELGVPGFRALKAIVLLALVTLVFFLAGCADYAPMESETPLNPPLPRTGSIVPLDRGNTWAYTCTVYDSAGDTVMSRAQLDLEISDVYGRTGNSLQLLEPWVYADTFEEYAYAYEWEQKNEL